MQNPNFAEYARLWGGFAVCVTAVEDLDKAIAEGISYEGSPLVGVVSDPELT